MEEQTKNPRIIIDASYIRRMDKYKAQSCFGAMCEQGGRIVIIDTLVRELLFTDDRRQWPASQIKLKTYLESIEVWEHVPIMWGSEIKKSHPYGDPLHCDNTQKIRQILRENTPHMTNNSDQDQENKESNGIIKLFKGLVGAQEFEQFAKEIKRESGNKDKLMEFCYNFVNNPCNIRLAIDIILSEAKIGSSLNPQNANDTWVIWHFGKSLLALLCDTQRKDEGSFNISEDLEEHLINTGYDLDYLVSLAFADAIASHDKREMSDYRQWMFGDTKPLIDSYGPEDIARVMDSLKSSSTDCFSQDLVARDQETLSQVDFMKLSLEERRQILAQQAEQMKSHYKQTKNERTEWQTGDFVDVY